MQKRNRLEYNYRAYNGTILNNRQVDKYNSIQADIDRWLQAGRKAPGWLLDWSARYFHIITTTEGRE